MSEVIKIKEDVKLPGTNVVLEKGDEIEVLQEMAVLKTKRTNLPVDIWIDDGGTWKETGHGNRIKFAKEKGATANSRTMVPMSISDNPEVLLKDQSDIKLSVSEINSIKQFVIDNITILNRVSDPNDDFDISDFMVEMIPYSK